MTKVLQERVRSMYKYVKFKYVQCLRKMNTRKINFTSDCKCLVEKLYTMKFQLKQKLFFDV